jgi:hypothetical protein
VSGVQPAQHGWTLHEFSKTFRTRHLVRPDTDRFVEELNSWMATQPGLVRVAPIIHRDRYGTVRSATLTCYASSAPAVDTFRFFRLPLLIGKTGWKHRDLGEVLNGWADEHPDYKRVWHAVLSSAGVPTECWVLSVGPPPLPVPSKPKSPRFRGAVLRRRFGAVMLFAVVVALMAVVEEATHTAGALGGLTLLASLLVTGTIMRQWSRSRRKVRVPIR